MTAPAPGWYPDPELPGQLRYWDGQQWTQHRAPSLSAAPPPLTASRMRRVDVVLTESWAVVRRAWWPIAAFAALLWGLWALLVLLLAALVDFGGWSRLLGDLIEADQQYPAGLPSGVAEAFEQRAADLAAGVGAGTWIAAGALLLIATVLIASAQAAGVYRLAAEAAAGRPATLATAWAGARTGTLRLVGYGLLLSIVGAAPVWLVIALAGGLSYAGWDAAAAGAIAIGMIAWFVLLVLVMVRLLPIWIQATVPGGAGALGWSWRATRGRFWAVLGRYLLWSLVASLAVNLVLTVLSLPLIALGAVAVLGAGLAWALLVVILVSVVLTGAVNAFTTIGLAPIWRDLTADPAYRSIGPDGRVAEAGRGPV